MITDQDITKLKKTFLTKADFAKASKAFATKEDFADLRLEFGEFRDKLDGLITTVQNFVGKIYDLEQENKAGGSVLARRTRHIDHLANHMGTILPD